MPHSIKSKRTLASCLLLATVFFNAGCASILGVAGKEPGTDQPMVQKAPPGALDHPVIQPYEGPHPRTIERPADPFKYPIAIGQTGPVKQFFAGAQEYPFLCQSQESGLGQPEVDNQEGYGVPVYKEVDGKVTDKIKGYSKDCTLKTKAVYYYNLAGTSKFEAYTPDVPIDSIEKIEINGQTMPFILRIEWGTINRYIYAILAIKGLNENIEKPKADGWNKRLIVEFRGGVGIGFKQGKNRPVTLTESRYQQLKKGYALVYSSGLQTSNHYHIWQSEELVVRLKNQFQSLYGQPLYTVGVGGSGGSIQQYLLAQNHPGLIDAAIPQYSYPDMVTQTIYAMDCDLLEYYFDLEDRSNTFWDTWENRSLIEGLSARSVKEHEYARLYQWSRLVNGYFPLKPKGLSECVLGWRGPAQVSINPMYTHYYYMYGEDVLKQVHWTHWENLKQFYGTDEKGYANALADNTGVQYGLESYVSGKIDFETFMQVNHYVGSWREQSDMRPAKFWKFSGADDGLTDVNIWSSQNIRQGDSENQAPRSVLNPKAVEAAFRSGMVFLGKADLPIVDLRHYNDDVQDMHHSFASFTIRQRIQDAMGSSDHQVIWMARREFNPTDKAFEVIDEWMLNHINHPELTIAQAKPASLQDTCFNSAGEVMHQGDDVWDGEWNQKPQGACMKEMPAFKSSRQVAGEDIRDLTFKCQLMSLDAAIAKGIYGSKTKELKQPEHMKSMHALFPDGVCDYSKPGAGELNAEQLQLK